MIKKKLLKIPYYLLIDCFRWFNIVNNVKISKDEVGLIFPYGIGDLYYVCSILNSYIIKNNIFRVILIVKPSQKDILLLFPNLRNKIIVTETPGNYFLYLINKCFKKYSRIDKGNLVVAHPSFINNKDFNNMGKNGDDIFDVYNKMFDLPKSNLGELPIIPKDSVKAANNIFSSYKLRKGHTVLIAPEANSLDCFPIKLWESIIEKLTSHKFDVVINGNSLVHKKAINIKLNLTEVVPFINVAGYFISIRSGICDLASTSKCTKIIIYPDITAASGTEISCFSIKRHSNYGKLIEFIYNKDTDLSMLSKNIIKKMIRDKQL